MSFDKIVEAIIQEALARGEFDDLPGKGKPIDLTTYFGTPEDVRNACALLKNAGIFPIEIEILQEIADMKQRAQVSMDDAEVRLIYRQIQEKQLQFSLLMEQHKRL